MNHNKYLIKAIALIVGGMILFLKTPLIFALSLKLFRPEHLAEPLVLGIFYGMPLLVIASIVIIIFGLISLNKYMKLRK